MLAKIPLKYSVFPFFLTAAAMVALFAPLPAWPRGVLALTFFFGMGAILGDALLPTERLFWKAYFGFLGFTAAVVVAGSALYLAASLDPGMTALLLAACAAAAAAYAAWARRPRSPFGAPPAERTDEGAQGATASSLLRGAGGIAAAAISLGLVGYCFAILASAATDGSIRSPWDVVPRMFFVVFFLAVAACFTAAHGRLAPRLALIPASALLVLAVSVAATVYEVGFGFDPFIHRATEQVIFSQGMISPKPLYYVGHYVAVTVIARLVGGFVPQVDAAVVPGTLALVAPCAYYAIRKTFGFSRASSAAAAATFMVFPLSAFASSTPQGFADAVFLLAAFCALPASTGAFPRRLVVILSLATAAIHPLAGIPLLMFACVLAYLSSTGRARGALKAVRGAGLISIAIVGAVALPAVFMLNSWLSGANVSIDLESLATRSAAIEALSSPAVATRQFMAAYDLVYSWKAFRSTAILLAAAAGLWLLYRKTRNGLVFLVGGFVFLANFVLMRSVVRFPFLISYERSNYADRIFELLLFLAAPLALAAAAAAFERMRRHGPAVRIGTTVLIAALAAASLYLDYPRRDKYESSRGWSTSGYDVRAVRLIDQDARGAPYVVLANQSTSAAAVREFGFKKYFPSKDPVSSSVSEPIFYYPIPTGGPLYARFLDMNDERGTRAAALAAMDLVGADTAYYVVTYYWWDAQRIIISAKKEADRWWTVDDKNFVFKYVRKK